MKGISIGSFLFALPAICTLVPPLHAQETNSPAVVPNAANSLPMNNGSLEATEIGTGRQEAGLALGAGFSASGIGDKSTHDLALSKFYYGHVLGDLEGPDKWYQGNWELLEEIFAGGQFNPESHYLVGETTVIRYNFVTGTRWVPFLDGGAGVLGTDIGGPDLGTVFEFNEQGGPGIKYFWRKDSALTFQYRYTHMSNAGIKEPNQGVNEHMFYAGITWDF